MRSAELDIELPLAPGARIGLVATAGPPVGSQLERAIELVRSWGLEPKVFESCRTAHPRASYLAGPDELRASDLQQAWCDPDIEAIFVIRGGYGTVRMLDLLDVEAMRRARSKPVLGSSDVTALHEFLAERLGVPSWFTPMISTGAVLDDEVATRRLRAVVLGAPDPVLIGTETMVAGEGCGVLIGGNLSLLAMTLADRGRPPMQHQDTIVMLEDIGEDTYRLDGFLTSLLRAGWFDGVRGIVLGTWLDCAPAEVRLLCAELLGALEVPMGWGFDLGHEAGADGIKLGVPVRLVAEPGEPPVLHRHAD